MGFIGRIVLVEQYFSWFSFCCYYSLMQFSGRGLYCFGLSAKGLVFLRCGDEGMVEELS